MLWKLGAYRERERERERHIYVYTYVYTCIYVCMYFIYIYVYIDFLTACGDVTNGEQTETTKLHGVVLGLG